MLPSAGCVSDEACRLVGYQVSGGGSTILLSATSDVPTFLLSSSALLATPIWNAFSTFPYPVGLDPDSCFRWVTGQPSLSISPGTGGIL